jgi:hypothetical protein
MGMYEEALPFLELERIHQHLGQHLKRLIFQILEHM